MNRLKVKENLRRVSILISSLNEIKIEYPSVYLPKLPSSLVNSEI